MLAYIMEIFFTWSNSCEFALLYFASCYRFAECLVSIHWMFVLMIWSIIIFLKTWQTRRNLSWSWNPVVWSNSQTVELSCPCKFMPTLHPSYPILCWCIAKFSSWWRHQMGTFFRITGHLCGEFTGHWWIPHTKASDAELWCFLWSAPE